jgi:hypothetical protein
MASPRRAAPPCRAHVTANRCRAERAGERGHVVCGRIVLAAAGDDPSGDRVHVAEEEERQAAAPRRRRRGSGRAASAPGCHRYFSLRVVSAPCSSRRRIPVAPLPALQPIGTDGTLTTKTRVVSPAAVRSSARLLRHEGRTLGFEREVAAAVPQQQLEQVAERSVPNDSLAPRGDRERRCRPARVVAAASGRNSG